MRDARSVRRFAGVGVRFGVRAELGTDFVAEEEQQWARDGRHAGADHSYVAFEAAPQRDVVVVVGCVGDLAEGGEVAEADDAA